MTGELYGADGLMLVTDDLDLARGRGRTVRSSTWLPGCHGQHRPAARPLSLLGQASPTPGPRPSTLCRYRAICSRARVRINIEPINRYETDFIMTAAEACA